MCGSDEVEGWGGGGEEGGRGKWGRGEREGEEETNMWKQQEGLPEFLLLRDLI